MKKVQFALLIILALLFVGDIATRVYAQTPSSINVSVPPAFVFAGGVGEDGNGYLLRVNADGSVKCAQ